MNERDKERLSLIPVLAESHPSHHIGRTALMKYMYFLQTLRGVQLGYNFSMYSYGPFDADVLSDLSTAEAMNIVCSTHVSFAGGYGYRIQQAEGSLRIKQDANCFLSQHRADIDWLLKEFGGLNSGELELASTIIYVDREFNDLQVHSEPALLVGVVNEIKPRFSRECVETSFNSLLEKGLLVSV
jgi:uncharacterized protein